MSEYIFVRHAQTNGNLRERIHGYTNHSINNEGKQQAVRLVRELESLPIDVCFTSPMRRCIQTARILCAGRDIPIIIDPRLTERCYGEMEGKHFNHIDYEGFWGRDGCEVKYSGAETLSDIRSRVEEFIRDAESRFAGKTKLVITHGSVIRTIRGVHMGDDFDGDYSALGRTDNCGTCRIRNMRIGIDNLNG